MTLSPADCDTFITQHTRITSAPLTPGLRFHLADETLAIWTRTEEALGEIGLPPPFWAFACGCGVAGIGAAKAGAARVDASGIDPFAVAATRLNAGLNDVAVDAQLADLIGTDAGWDVVLAGDVFYEAPGASRIADWLASLDARGALVLIGDPGRTFLPRSRLEALARYDTPVSRDLEDREVRQARVWRFTGKPQAPDGA